MKNKILYILITLFIFNFTILSNNVSFAATITSEKNIDLVILFNDNSIDKKVEDAVISSGGKIMKEFPDLGGIEVKCPSNLITTIKSKDGVQSLAPTM